MKADKLTGYILQHPDGRFLTAINQNKQRYALTWDSPRFYKDKDRAEFAVKKHFRKYPGLIVRKVTISIHSTVQRNVNNILPLGGQ